MIDNYNIIMMQESLLFLSFANDVMLCSAPKKEEGSGMAGMMTFLNYIPETEFLFGKCSEHSPNNVRIR